MPTQNEALAELYRRGALTETQSAAVEELGRRGVLSLDTGEAAPRSDYRNQLMQEMAGEVGPMQAALIGTGKGFMTLARGVGLAEPETPEEAAGYAALEEARPYTTGAGEIVGEAAPFVIPGAQVGRIPAMAGRIAAGAGMGAVESGIIAAGAERDVVGEAGVGAGIGAGAEVLFPVIGRMGRKIFQKVTGRMPRGAMLDAAGQPTAELSDALQQAGLSFEDLTQDAAEVISGTRPGAVPEQVARAATFAEEGIPPTTGEISREFTQQATEQRLLESGADVAAEPFRQFKLKQSEKIKEVLGNVFQGDVTKEETGGLIQDALTGRKKLLRTQKNALYSEAAESAKDVGGVPLFTDTLKESIPDVDMMEDLAITAPGAIESLDKILTKYGIKEPTEEMVEAGFEPTPLTIQNFERFRKTLNAIAKGDQTGAAGVAINQIKSALDGELDELAGALAEKGVSVDIIKPLKAARKTVRELKTEFSPQSIIGNIIDVKKDGVTQITEASKVYDKMLAKSQPVESVRRVMSSLGKSPKGDQAAASLQATTMLDLVDAGFGTESRKISGIKTFNPGAFKKRLKAIGKPKLQAIFANNPAALKKINNIDKISTQLIPESGAVPKGSASVILDLMNNLGFASISAKVPLLGPLVAGTIKGVTEPIKTGAAVKKAVAGAPDVIAFRSLIDKQFPGIASAIAIPAVQEMEEK